jgi:hypothetical protein
LCYSNTAKISLKKVRSAPFFVLVTNENKLKTSIEKNYTPLPKKNLMEVRKMPIAK